MTAVADVPTTKSSARVGCDVALASWSVHVPGADLRDLLGASAPSEMCEPGRAHEVLGRKGLLSKEPATRLALCAVHRALGFTPNAPKPTGPVDPRVAVVACSNFGNVATVREVALTARERSGRDVSPLEAPNASSNVVASSVALWFRFGGPNLMICSGATAGIDAVAMASLLLRAGRADRVVVVGTEPDDEVAASLNACRADRTAASRPLRGAAACVVLERRVAGSRHASLVVGGTSSKLGPRRPEPGWAPVVVGPGTLAADASRVLDVSDLLGECYGALGVLQLAIGSAHLDAGSAQRVDVVCGDAADGWRVATLRSTNDQPTGSD